MKFAGFIMTYERESILLNTIQTIFSQTIPPEKILIIDNSTSHNTENLINNLNNPKVFYHRVGYNSGPAGAAGIGLSMLAEEGYDWIYWGDDDDPPVFMDSFEVLLKTAISDSKCGCVGAVGHFFNKKTGFIDRVSDEVLYTEGILSVDNIAGGMSKIVNGKMIAKFKIVPNEKLFYGFEELDFDLKIKNMGYKLLVNKSLFLRHRLKYKRIGISSIRYQKKTKNNILREYYSTRNMLYILFYNHYIIAFINILIYTFFKQFMRLRDGVDYCLLGFKITLLAWFHFLTGKMGKMG